MNGKAISLFGAVALGFGFTASGGLKDLWFFGESPFMDDPAQLPIMTNVIRRAGAAGYTGFAFISGRDCYGNWREIDCRNDGSRLFVSSHIGLDSLWRMDRGRLARFKAMKRACDAAKIDFIPLIWSVGYGSMNMDDPNRVACWPSPDVPYAVRGGKAVFAPERVAYDAHAFDGVSAKTNRLGRWSAETSVAVKPMRRYRVSGEVRTADVACAPRLLQGISFHLHGVTADGVDRTFVSRFLTMEPTQDWTPFDLDFHSETATEVGMRLAALANPDGRLEVRGLKVEEAPIEYVVRREGTPFSVRDAVTGKAYVEGVDYAPVACLDRISFNRPERPLELTVLPGGSIRDGAKLLVSAYEPRCTFGVQYSSCLSNPELPAYLKRSAQALEREFGLKKWFLSLDEIRVGCRCELCEHGGKAIGGLLTKSIVRMREAIRAVRPDAEIFMWSDMVDPNHNAQKDYYHCRTSFEGALDGVPADIVMVPWWEKKAGVCVETLAAHGHEVLGGAFYDKRTRADMEANAATWLEALRRTPKSRGIMYTTWQNGRDGGNYEFLEEFARYVLTNERICR